MGWHCFTSISVLGIVISRCICAVVGLLSQEYVMGDCGGAVRRKCGSG